MSTGLPLDDTDILRRIRALRADRAQRHVADARAAADAADAAAAERQVHVDAVRAALAEWRAAIGTTLAPDLPRWSSMLFAREAHLAEQLERAEDKLLSARETRDEARQALAAAQRALVAARRREHVAGDLVQRARREAARAHECRLERDDEPARRAADGASR